MELGGGGGKKKKETKNNILYILFFVDNVEMNSTFLLFGKMLYIKEMKKNDLRHYYYNVMRLLSDDDKIIVHNMIHSMDYSSHIDNLHIFYIVEDIDAYIVVGIGKVAIKKYSSTTCVFGNIQYLMFHTDYLSVELREKLLEYIRFDCLFKKKFVRLLDDRS